MNNHDKQKAQRDSWRKRQQKRQERSHGSTFATMKVTMSPGVDESLAHQLVLAVEERYKGRPLEIPRGCILEADGQKYTVLIDHQKREILVWLGDSREMPEE